MLKRREFTCKIATKFPLNWTEWVTNCLLPQITGTLLSFTNSEGYTVSMYHELTIHM
jgi:hypothetical protein